MKKNDALFFQMYIDQDTEQLGVPVCSKVQNERGLNDPM